MHVEYTGEGASQLESDSYSLAASFCCLERFTIAGKGPAVEAFPRWPLDVVGGWLSSLSMLVAAGAHEKFTRVNFRIHLSSLTGEIAAKGRVGERSSQLA
jgi:hypothetical protein